MSPRNHTVALAESQHHIINPANPRRALDDGIEHRLHVRRRAADDAEHLGCCRLMLQRLAQFCIALLQFLEQPDVLDSDDRLIGEGLDKLDLLVGERSQRSHAKLRLLRLPFPLAAMVRDKQRSRSTLARRDCSDHAPLQYPRSVSLFAR